MNDWHGGETRVRNICPKHCEPLQKIVGSLKWRLASRDSSEYPGTLFMVTYYWCMECNKGYMSADQCSTDLLHERAKNGELEFVCMPLEEPLKKIEVVDWLRE
jgi:hypothetical protein